MTRPPPGGRAATGALHADLTRLDGHQEPVVSQVTGERLARHLLGMAAKLQSGESGTIRDALQQSVVRILAGVDGSLPIAAKPGGLLGLNGNIAQSEGREEWPPIEPNMLSVGGRV